MNTIGDKTVAQQPDFGSDVFEIWFSLADVMYVLLLSSNYNHCIAIGFFVDYTKSCFIFISRTGISCVHLTNKQYHEFIGMMMSIEI